MTIDVVAGDHVSEQVCPENTSIVEGIVRSVYELFRILLSLRERGTVRFLVVCRIEHIFDLIAADYGKQTCE